MDYDLNGTKLSSKKSRTNVIKKFQVCPNFFCERFEYKVVKNSFLKFKHLNQKNICLNFFSKQSFFLIFFLIDTDGLSVVIPTLWNSLT